MMPVMYLPIPGLRELTKIKLKKEGLSHAENGQ
jgi:hypothetical protein